LDNRSNNVIALVGAFPPPVHGMSVVNEAIKNELIKCDAEHIIFDVSQRDVTRNFISRISRVYKVIIQLLKFIGKINTWDVLYISQSGGKGRIYELCFVLIAIMLRRRVYLHHHSFSYLDQKDLLANIIFSLSNTLLLHVVLCKKMSEKIKHLYGSSISTFVLSNASFIKRNNNVRLKNSLTTLGFISNIVEDKGIFEFLDLFNKLTQKMTIKGVIAGPFLSEKVKKNVMLIVDEYENLEYRGACYGSDKELLFHELDLLVFPTKYKNEAEPLVIYEAYSYAVPVIAWGRGCIDDMSNIECRMTVDPENPFVEGALSYIDNNFMDAKSIEEKSQEVHNFFNEHYSLTKSRLTDLVNMMIGEK
jgi:glycosyltransferase involved in cell wall biosynthesis